MQAEFSKKIFDKITSQAHLGLTEPDDLAVRSRLSLPLAAAGQAYYSPGDKHQRRHIRGVTAICRRIGLDRPADPSLEFQFRYHSHGNSYGAICPVAYDIDNAFAKILRGELPCLKLHEDERTLSFMDIMPQSDGHALVIPKEPAETLFELSEEATVACIRTVHRLARAVQQAMSSDGVMVLQANGSAAGQTVPHVHFHVIPRYQGKAILMHAAQKADMTKLEDFAERIKKAFVPGNGSFLSS